ncbi:MAG: ABC transporter permease [Tannerellaceae bacterium]|jgi:ABC-2 type transport system permease protein|nr:ABC transporter permease [Tannerellaceae bacterium]
MNKTGIIIRREYLRRVSKKSFLLLTLLMPFLIVAMAFVPLWLAQIRSGEARNVVVIDMTGKYATLFESDRDYTFISTAETLDNYRRGSNKEAFAILSITADLLDSPSSATLYSEKQIPADLSRIVNRTLSRRIESDKLDTFNIPNLKDIIESSKVDFSVRTVKWSGDGAESDSSATTASIVAMASTIFIYMFIIMYGSMVMQGVLEEKTNRIVELMISSVRPVDLMMGKIVALGLVGLTQMFIWGVMTACLFAGGMIFMTGTGPVDMGAGMMGQGIYDALPAIDFAGLGVSFLVYFVGGYLLYASMFAAIGASVSQQEDTQQFITPVMLIMVFAMYAGIYSMNNPDGPLAFWCSLIPFTSPVVMMTRIPFEVALWEEALSVAILYATAFAITRLSARIYRVGILMYGKKPALKEIIRWIRYN